MVAAALDAEEREEAEAKARGVAYVRPVWRPESNDWTSQHELLAGVWDRLGALSALVADLPTPIKKRHEHPAPYPRPETELDRQRKAREKAREKAYDDRLLGDVERAKQRWREQNPDAPVMRRAQ